MTTRSGRRSRYSSRPNSRASAPPARRRRSPRRVAGVEPHVARGQHRRPRRAAYAASARAAGPAARRRRTAWSGSRRRRTSSPSAWSCSPSLAESISTGTQFCLARAGRGPPRSPDSRGSITSSTTASKSPCRARSSPVSAVGGDLDDEPVVDAGPGAGRAPAAPRPRPAEAAWPQTGTRSAQPRPPLSAISQGVSRHSWWHDASSRVDPSLRWLVPAVVAVVLAAGGSTLGLLVRERPGPAAAAHPRPAARRRPAGPASTGCPGTVVQNADLGLPSLPGRRRRAAART